MGKERLRAYWNDNTSDKQKEYERVKVTNFNLANSEGQPEPCLSVSTDPTGFISVLAQPAGTNRIISLTLQESPELGVYKFIPANRNHDFDVKIKFHEEPFPDPHMHTLDLQSPLCDVTVGDEIIIHLRKDTTESPGVKQVKGTVIKVVESCGAVPDVSKGALDASDYPIVSISAHFSEQTITDLDDAKVLPELSHRIDPIGDTQGTLDVIGASEPFEIRWEGSKDTPRLSVESVTVESPNDESWTVENESLPEVQFTPLQDLTYDERLREFKSAFERVSDITVPQEVLQLFASAVDEPVPGIQLTVRYDSPRSEEVQSKTGELDSVRSVYYAEPNRARHQIRFQNAGLYYILVDSHPDAESPVSVYSTSSARHWDTDLGDIRDIIVSKTE